MTSVSPKVKFRSKKPERHISVSEETCLTIAAYNFSPLIVLYLQKTSAMLISAWTKVICALSAKKEKHQCDQKSFGTHIPSCLGQLRAHGREVCLPPPNPYVARQRQSLFEYKFQEHGKINKFLRGSHLLLPVVGEVEKQQHRWQRWRA